jgi:hypothetical protein
MDSVNKGNNVECTECTDKTQQLLVGKFCVTTYLFTVDHHDRLFFFSVLACVQVILVPKNAIILTVGLSSKRAKPLATPSNFDDRRYRRFSIM